MTMLRRRSGWVGSVWALCGLALLLTGCARQSGLTRVDPAVAGVAPALTVERFLNAVNAGDLDTMARLFGTADGSVLRRDRPSDVEARMYALAAILRHKSYLVESEDIVPGRLGQAVRLQLLLELEHRRVSVPFVVVKTRSDGWLIEQIGVERITAGGGG